jgi:hypothetical protein
MRRLPNDRSAALRPARNRAALGAGPSSRRLGISRARDCLHGVRGFARSFRTAERERVIGEWMGSAGVWMVAAGGSVLLLVFMQD